MIDNPFHGPEFTAKDVREWLGRIGAGTLFIEPGSSWENGYVESFIGKLRDKLLSSYRRLEDEIQPVPASQLSGI